MGVTDKAQSVLMLCYTLAFNNNTAVKSVHCQE